MDLETLNPDRVEEVFARHGASSITLTDAGDRPVLEPAPGEAPLWPDTRICGPFSTEVDFADPQAIRATHANAANNAVEDRLRTTLEADDIDDQFDIVVANILAGPLIDFAGSIASHVKSGCLLALSGILSEQVEAVLTAYSPWIEFDEPVIQAQGGQAWVRLTGRRIEG